MITLNLGAGAQCFSTYPTPDYMVVNIDERDLPQIDMICDVAVMKHLKDEYADYILASHIIEHFPIKRCQAILCEWKRLLKPNGIMEIQLPNLRAIAEEYILHGNAKLANKNLMGDQDYPGNYHYAQYDRKSFLEEIVKAGLKLRDCEVSGTIMKFFMEI